MDITALINAGILPEQFDQVNLGLNSKGMIIKVIPKYFSWLMADSIIRTHFNVERCYPDGEVDQLYTVIIEASNNFHVDYSGALVEKVEVTNEESGEITLEWPSDSIGEYDYITTIATQQVRVKNIIYGYIPSLFARGKFDKPQS